MAMFTHVTVGTNDLAKAQAFYDAALGALGWGRIADFGDKGSAWGLDGVMGFLALRPRDGAPACVGNGATISFAAPSREAVAAFHAAALGHGGADEGAPGPRSFAPNAFGGYVRDPDGNKLAAFCYAPD